MMTAAKPTDEEEEDEESSYLQRVGLGQALQFGPNPVQDVQNLFFHLHYCPGTEARQTHTVSSH